MKNEKSAKPEDRGGGEGMSESIERVWERFTNTKYGMEKTPLGNWVRYEDVADLLGDLGDLKRRWIDMVRVKAGDDEFNAAAHQFTRELESVIVLRRANDT